MNKTKHLSRYFFLAGSLTLGSAAAVQAQSVDEAAAIDADEAADVKATETGAAPAGILPIPDYSGSF